VREKGKCAVAGTRETWDVAERVGNVGHLREMQDEET